MKKTAVAIVLIAVLCIFTGCLKFRSSVSSSVSYKYDNADKYIAGNGSVQASQVKKLDIDWVAGSVTVVPGSGSEVRFSEEYKGKLDEDLIMRWYLDGSTLRIKFRKAGTLIGDAREKHLTVVVPSSLLLSNLDVDYVSCDVRVEANSVNYDFEGVSGSLNLKADTPRIVDVDTVSGNLNMEFARCPDKLEIDTVSGNVDVKIPKSSSFNARFDSVSGSFVSSIPVVMDGKRYVAGDGKSDLSLETVSGSVKIRF